MYKIERFRWKSRLNEWFILIYKRLNDNVHFCTLSRVNINYQIKRKPPLYLYREIKPSAMRGIRCSAAASLPFFMITITDAPHVSHVPLWRCLKPLCASYLESVLENVGRNRVKSAQALRNVFYVGCSLGFDTQPMYNVPAAADASCTPQSEITAAFDHIESYMMLHISCAKSIWSHYLEKPFYLCRLQL